MGNKCSFSLTRADSAKDMVKDSVKESNLLSKSQHPKQEIDAKSTEKVEESPEIKNLLDFVQVSPTVENGEKSSITYTDFKSCGTKCPCGDNCTCGDKCLCDVTAVPQPPCSIVGRVISKFTERSNIGMKKYGKTLDRDDLTMKDWTNHMQEELMDAILYLEKIKCIHETNFSKKGFYMSSSSSLDEELDMDQDQDDYSTPPLELRQIRWARFAGEKEL